jgi:flagellar hook-basal body complex protein FliE
MYPVGGIGSSIGPATGAGIGPISVRELQEVPAAPREAGGVSFGNVLGRLLGEVNEKQAVAGEAVNGLLAGKEVSLHQAMIAMEEASVSFQLMVEVRNKLLESYQELMRMQI